MQLPNRPVAERHGPRMAIRLLAACVWFAAQTVVDAEEPLGVFPIAEYDQLLYLTIEVAGIEHLAVLDSGCTYCVIDEGLPAAAQLERTDKSVHGSSGRSAPLPFVEGLAMRVGGLTLPPDTPVALLDFGELRSGLGRPVAAIVGMPLFRRCVVQLDFDNGRFQILPPSTTPTGEWGRFTKVSYHGGDLPHLSLALADDAPGAGPARINR